MATYLSKSFGAADYAKYRPTYPTKFFEYLVDYRAKHTSDPLENTVDFACGTGQASIALGEYSSKVHGFDHSEAMISEARKLNPDPSKFQFDVSTDLELASKVPPQSADLLTIAEAAHYLHYPEFWDQCAAILKPGGLLAIFSYWTFAFPDYPQVAEIINNYTFGEDQCGPHFDAGVLKLHHWYQELVDTLPKDKFEHVEHRSNDFDEFRPSEPFELCREQVPVSAMISLLKTWSPYFNWKRLNPDKPDIVDNVMRAIHEQTGLTESSLVTVKWKTVYLLAVRK